MFLTTGSVVLKVSFVYKNYVSCAAWNTEDVKHRPFRIVLGWGTGVVV